MRTAFLSLVIIVLLFSCKNDNNQIFPKIDVIYPVTKKVDTVDTYFGVKIDDPYRWLEDDNSTETANWVSAQNKVTFDYLSKIPFREQIKKRLTDVWNFEKVSSPFKEGSKYFYYKNDGLQNQSLLYIMDTVGKNDIVLLDPNTLSKDGTVSLNTLSFSKDGKYLAYSISKSGSDWNEIYVKDVDNNIQLNDSINWVKFSGISWYKDGFFYSRYDKPEEGNALKQKNKYHKVFYHKLGTNQKDDKLIFENKNEPLRTYQAIVTTNEKYLIMYEEASTSGNALYFKPLEQNNKPFKLIAEGFDFDYSLVDAIDNDLFIKTNENAPRYKLIKINLLNPSKENWSDVIAEKDNVLESVSLAANNIIAKYMKDAHSKLEIYSLTGNYERDIELSTFSTITGFNGKKNDNIAYYSVTTFTSPGNIYKYDFNTHTSTSFYTPNIDFNENEYITKQEFIKSKDGTMIPLFIVHKKDIKLDGNNPALLYGYGGFNISQTPKFRISNTIWLENGGIYAVACLRGGGEYGKKWHEAGTKLKKQNVFDDFIASAEYLINNKYSSPEKMAINGGSNGGLLVGAVTNQRPELFKVAIPAVGVMDMLRFHKFTIGWSWTGDYGSSDDSIQFQYLLKYSPIHNINENINYPAIMVTTADHDDRVVPAHSFKYISVLQEKYKGENPVLIRIDVKAGHGAGKPTSMQIDSAADMWAFIFYNMNISPKFRTSK